MRDCAAQAGTGTFLQFTGKETADIVLAGNDDRRAQIAVAVGGEVDGAAVHKW